MTPTNTFKSPTKAVSTLLSALLITLAACSPKPPEEPKTLCVVSGDQHVCVTTGDPPNVYVAGQLASPRGVDIDTELILTLDSWDEELADTQIYKLCLDAQKEFPGVVCDELYRFGRDADSAFDFSSADHAPGEYRDYTHTSPSITSNGWAYQSSPNQPALTVQFEMEVTQ